jgi:hypothetical protein
VNSRSTEILNSYIADIKAVGQDSQAIAGWNGPGPFAIINNYLEAAGENVLFGGADPAIAGLVPQDIVIRRNHIARPVTWRQAIVATPVGLMPRPVTSGPGTAADGPVAGTGGDPPRLVPGAYSYRVVAERRVAGGRALSSASEAVTVEIGDDHSAVMLEWQAVADAGSYRVYRRDADGRETWWRTPEPRFTDQNAPGETGVAPTKPTRWSVKNLLELKNARNVEIDGNLFEYNWLAAQDGYAILFKPVNQNGGAPWSSIENVRFTNNVVRHVAGAIAINGIDTAHPSARARDIRIQNNLFVDVSGAQWGGTGDFIKVGNGPVNVVVENNTVINDGRIINVTRGRGGESEGFVFRRNVVRHNRYGVKGQATASGLATLERFFPRAVFEENVIVGGRSAAYPRNNVVVPGEEFERLFVDAAAGDYRLRTPSSGAGVKIEALDASIIRARTIGTTVPATPRQSSN